MQGCDDSAKFLLFFKFLQLDAGITSFKRIPEFIVDRNLSPRIVAADFEQIEMNC